MKEIGKIMCCTPFFSLPRFLIPDSCKELQPPRYCYGWLIPDIWYSVWGEGDASLMAWTQIKNPSIRDERSSDVVVSEQWDPDYDDYGNYHVLVPDEERIRVNVARNWAERANLRLPLHDAPIVKIMARGKSYDLFALYDNYTLNDRLSPDEVDRLRSVWTTADNVDPQWYPVLPVDGQEFRWTPSGTQSSS